MTLAAARTNRAMMIAIVENAATGTTEDDTTGTSNLTLGATTTMTSSSDDTIFVQGTILGSAATAVGATNGATEELETTLNVLIGTIVYEVRSSSGADTIGSGWLNTTYQSTNAAVIPQSSGSSGTGFTITPDTDNLDAGDIKATGGFIHDVTDSSGNVLRSRVVSTDTSVKGNIRKSTTSPKFKTFNLAGNTVDDQAGLNVNVRMILDE
jgi:hypothetical protein